MRASFNYSNKESLISSKDLNIEELGELDYLVITTITKNNEMLYGYLDYKSVI